MPDPRQPASRAIDRENSARGNSHQGTTTSTRARPARLTATYLQEHNEGICVAKAAGPAKEFSYYAWLPGDRFAQARRAAPRWLDRVLPQLSVDPPERPGRAGRAGSGRRGRCAPVIQARPGPGGWDHRLDALAFDPPSGTRDFLAAELETRQRAFAVIDRVYTSYGFEPLQTQAFERLDVLMGKYGDEGDKLIFKILRRGEHEASGEADLALRYDLTVPLARVAAAYGSRLPSPYKRYALGPVWRADRPGKGRYREFTQCDLDTLGSASLLADAEVVCAQNEALTGLGVPGFASS